MSPTWNWPSASACRWPRVTAPSKKRIANGVAIYAPQQAPPVNETLTLPVRRDEPIPAFAGAVLAYPGRRVDELVKLKVRDYRTCGEHRVLNLAGTRNKERTTPLQPEAVERLLESRRMSLFRALFSKQRQHTSAS
jgi:integrase